MSGSIGRVGLLVLIAAISIAAAGCARSSPQGRETPNGQVAPTGQATPETSTPTSSASAPPSSAPPSRTPAPEEETAEIIAGMTLEQKVGQLIVAGVDGTTISDRAKRMIAEIHPGGIILFKNNLSGLEGSAQLLNGLKAANEKAANPVPLFLSVDQEGGRVSRLPPVFQAMPANGVVGESGSTELAERMGALIARQIKLLGFNVDFAPVLDIFSNPANTVIGDRSFGSKTGVVTDYGVAEMIGIRENGVIPVVKHFPGHGDTSVDSHVDLPVVNKTADQLAKFEWVPFEGAIESGADAVMVAHILYPNIDKGSPASLSKTVITKLLRGRLGFEGVVITDDLAMGAIANNYGIGEAAVRAVQAGADIALVGHQYANADLVHRALMDGVKAGKLTEARIEESVKRILALKLAYKLSDDAVAIPNARDIPNKEIESWLKELHTATASTSR